MSFLGKPLQIQLSSINQSNCGKVIFEKSYIIIEIIIASEHQIYLLKRALLLLGRAPNYLCKRALLLLGGAPITFPLWFVDIFFANLASLLCTQQTSNTSNFDDVSQLSNRRYCIWAFRNALWYWKGDKTKENPTGKNDYVVNITNRLSLLRAPTNQNAFVFSTKKKKTFLVLSILKTIMINFLPNLIINIFRQFYKVTK